MGIVGAMDVDGLSKVRKRGPMPGNKHEHDEKKRQCQQHDAAEQAPLGRQRAAT